MLGGASLKGPTTRIQTVGKTPCVHVQWQLPVRAFVLSIALLGALVGLAGCMAAPATLATQTPSPVTEPQKSPVGCLRADGGCLGVLSPGEYKSAHFTTFGQFSPGQLTFSVSDGYWANALDHNPAYWFEPAIPYAAGTGDDPLPGVFVWGDVAAASQSFPSCPETSDPAGPTDAAGLIQWISKLPAVTATPVQGLIAGGASVDGVEVVVDSATAPRCDGTGQVALLIAGRPNAPDPYLWGVTTHERAQVFLVDLGEGHLAAIFIQAPNDGFDKLLPEARKLMATFQFTAP